MTAFLLDPGSGRRRNLGPGELLGRMFWSADSQAVGRFSLDSLILIDAATGHRHELRLGPWLPDADVPPVWSPDRRQLAFLGSRVGDDGLKTKVLVIDAL